MATLGEIRVGTAFNPSGNDGVAEIKAVAADLINRINAIPVKNSETPRWKAMAMTEIETGAMYAVKALTAGE